jgi:hypothetical protein
MRIPVALLLAGSLMAGTPAYAGGLSDILQNPIKDLIAKDTDVRSTARDLIQKQVEASQPSEKRSLTDELLQKVKSAPQPADRVTAAIALSKYPTPWEATDHDNQIKDLYQTFLTTQDPALKRYIDDALANAKGLYLDAINDFNGDRVENPAATAAKFARMPNDFPKSRYAASSAYYLGQYWTRVAFIQSNFPDNIPKSDEAFKSFIERSKANAFASADSLTDAYFFKALNRILVGKEQEALAQLADMKKEFASRNPNVYVYQLFYKTRDKSTEIDRYIPALTLIGATTSFIQENPGRLPAAQSELAKQLLSSTKS